MFVSDVDMSENFIANNLILNYKMFQTGTHRWQGFRKRHTLKFLLTRICVSL